MIEVTDPIPELPPFELSLPEPSLPLLAEPPLVLPDPPDPDRLVDPVTVVPKPTPPGPVADTWKS